MAQGIHRSLFDHIAERHHFCNVHLIRCGISVCNPGELNIAAHFLQTGHTLHPLYRVRLPAGRWCVLRLVRELRMVLFPKWPAWCSQRRTGSFVSLQSQRSPGSRCAPQFGHTLKYIEKPPFLKFTIAWQFTRPIHRYAAPIRANRQPCVPKRLRGYGDLPYPRMFSLSSILQLRFWQLSHPLPAHTQKQGTKRP